MRRKFAALCLLAAWLCANGVVWNAVQVIGWAKMFHDYAQVMPAAQALQVTFSGEAPCDFCDLAASGSEASRETQSPAALGSNPEKILLIAECVPVPVLVAPEISWPGIVHDAGLTRTEKVPVTPPRV